MDISSIQQRAYAFGSNKDLVSILFLLLTKFSLSLIFSALSEEKKMVDFVRTLSLFVVCHT